MSPFQAAFDRSSQAVPPQAWFGVSAVFHYLGPSFAVLLFPAIGVLGTAWLRIAAASLLLAPATRPWRRLRQARPAERAMLLAHGVCLAGMNCSFYLALDRLPMSLVAAIEFLGPICLALYGLRSRRNVAALLLAVAGVFVMIRPTWSDDLPGLLWAGLDAALFIVYIALGHRLAASGAGAGIERLGAAMAIAFVAVFPIGLGQAVKAFADPVLILAGFGVGLCSSVIPYVCDQLAMARLPRASFALLLSLLPASATIIGAIVLAQIPSARDLAGIALVMAGVALHRPV